MNKLGVGRGIKVHGNVNRILEMIDGGAGDNAISGHFKDEKVSISPQFVREIRLGINDLSKKAVSKKSTIKAIKALKDDKKSDDVFDDGCIVQ